MTSFQLFNDDGNLFHNLGPCTLVNFSPYCVVLAVGTNKVLVKVELQMSTYLDLVL